MKPTLVISCLLFFAIADLGVHSQYNGLFGFPFNRPIRNLIAPINSIFAPVRKPFFLAPEENLFGPSPAYNGPGPTTRMDDFLLPTATPKLQPDDINNIPDEPIVKPTEPDVTPKPAVDLSDQDRDVPRLIKSRGFEVQTHTVTTVDNYNLTLFRIVNPRQSLPGRPVVLQHGLVGSAADWLVNQIGGHIDEILPNGVVGANLGFELAKRGFDVWLSNSRGNTYSPIPDVKELWNFSFDQHIKYDTPAVIDYVLYVTRRKNLAWVGHSQGTLVMFGLLSTQPKYNELVKPFIALAPVTTVSHIRSPIRYIAKTPFLLSFIRSRGGQFMPSNQIMKLLGAACPAGLQPLCTNLIFVLVGYNQEQLNEDRLPVYLSHTPAGTSAWNIVHFGQNYLAGRFQRFDFGNDKKNMDIYGQSVPPVYDLSKITNKHIALFSSLNDWLATPEDVHTLKHTLTVPLLEDHVIPNPKWNHLDFIWGKDAGEVVYKRTIDLLDEFADTHEVARDNHTSNYNSVYGA